MAKKPIINMIKKAINILCRGLGIKRRMFIMPAAESPTHRTISYAITVCNEADALRHLLDFLIPYLQAGDEIVVQADKKNVTDAVRQVAKDYKKVISTYVEYELNFDFAQAKNHLNEQCHGEWIFQLDADECPQEFLMNHLQAILCANTGAELYKVPRINLFSDEKGAIKENHVAWPDYQGRIYKNEPQRIRWQRPLHEKIRGHHAYVYLPKDDAYAILHLKVKDQDNAKWQQWKQHYQ